MSIKWPQTTVETPEGPCTAIAPWIISASRATDIPACYGEWFFDRLEKGYVRKIQRLGEILHPFTEKLVFSFADIANYKKVRSNLARQGVEYRDFNTIAMTNMARKISDINRPWGLKLATCGC